MLFRSRLILAPLILFRTFHRLLHVLGCRRPRGREEENGVVEQTTIGRGEGSKVWKQVKWPGPCGGRLAHHEACGCSRRVRPACLVEMASRCTMPGVTRQGFNIHSQALECSKSISSGDIVCEVGCSCGDKQGRAQVTDAARKHSSNSMVQGEETV